MIILVASGRKGNVTDRGSSFRQIPPKTAMGADIANNDEPSAPLGVTMMDIKYPGGKGQLYQKIINLIPPHRVYIEPFAGGGTILRRKLLTQCNIAIDADIAPLSRLRSAIVKNSDDAGQYEFINTDALEWLKQYSFRGDEFIYADPPYLMRTRRQHRQLYRCELGSDADHRRLLDVLTQIPCKIMLSGYLSDLYEDKLRDWYTRSYNVRTRGGTWATEWLWMNYPEPTVLHDYRYLGDDYRERERIKRKISRWASKFRGLETLEQQAILSALLRG